jgi:hypothetical protein
MPLLPVLYFGQPRHETEEKFDRPKLFLSRLAVFGAETHCDNPIGFLSIQRAHMLADFSGGD